MKPKHEVALDWLKRRGDEITRVVLESGAELRVWNVAWGYDPGEEVAHVTTNASPPPVDDYDIDFFHASEIVRIEDYETSVVLWCRAEVAPDDGLATPRGGSS